MSSTSEAWYVARTLRALELLAVGPRSAPELADELGVHVRTARRMLKRFAVEGYATLGSGRRRRYRSTMRIVAVAGQVVERAELTSVAVPYVQALREQVGEECHLSVPSLLSVLCLMHAPRDRVSEFRPQLRELVPCHCTATGKALLAWRDRWCKAVLAQPLRSFTDRTLTGPDCCGASWHGPALAASPSRIASSKTTPEPSRSLSSVASRPSRHSASLLQSTGSSPTASRQSPKRPGAWPLTSRQTCA
jgi:hypothetical protein